MQYAATMSTAATQLEFERERVEEIIASVRQSEDTTYLTKSLGYITAAIDALKKAEAPRCPKCGYLIVPEGCSEE